MIARREWGWAALAALAAMLFTTAPYVVAARAQTPDWRFSGFLLAVEDGNSYIAKMQEGARGAWLFTLPYTSEPQRGAFLFSFYLLLGKLVGTGHASLVLAFHAARVVCGVAMLLASYRFLAEFLPEASQRQLGLWLVALGGGLGWLVSLAAPGPVLGSLPVDFISPEAFSFLTLFGLPHLALARALLLLALLAYLRRRGLLAGLALLGVGLVQPLDVLVAWLIMAADTALGLVLAPDRRGQLAREGAARRNLQTAVAAAALSAPIVGYTILAFSLDPLLRQWNAQNRLPSPSPVHYLLAYGLYIVPAAAGWMWLWRCRRRLAVLAAAWLALAPLLLYLPIPTQRRLIDGVQLPVVALAVLGLTSGALAAQRWPRPLLVTLCLLTAPMLWLGAVALAREPSEPIFVPSAQIAAFNWLARDGPGGAVVLSAFETGNALPAYAPQVAYVGHGPESVHLSEKLPRVARFYQSGASDAERRALLADGRIRYVLAGPHERALGDFDLASADYLARRFEDGGYEVWEVVR